MKEVYFLVYIGPSQARSGHLAEIRTKLRCKDASRVIETSIDMPGIHVTHLVAVPWHYASTESQ